jgi:hypothetical protein
MIAIDHCGKTTSRRTGEQYFACIPQAVPRFCICYDCVKNHPATIVHRRTIHRHRASFCPSERATITVFDIQQAPIGEFALRMVTRQHAMRNVHCLWVAFGRAEMCLRAPEAVRVCILRRVGRSTWIAPAATL